VASISEIPLGTGMTAEQAREIFRAGEEAVIFALLEQAKMLARNAVGHDARLCENAGQNTVEKAGARKGASRQPTRPAGAD
jgi:hypothetical protein